MSIIKGSRLIYCKECKRKRFCISKNLPGAYRQWTCSKGHIWRVELATLERLDRIVRETITPEVVKNIFERDNAFFVYLKRR